MSDNKEPEIRTGLTDVLDKVLLEVKTAERNWPRYNSAHEAYGVIVEEVHEFERHVFDNQKIRNATAMQNELIQIAATAIRAAACIERDKEWVRR